MSRPLAVLSIPHVVRIQGVETDRIDSITGKDAQNRIRGNGYDCATLAHCIEIVTQRRTLFSGPIAASSL